MTITKYGQCCLLIEYNGKRILTDPGGFGTGFTTLTDLDLILITHEHADHLHTESLKTIVTNNPQARVVTNSAVSTILSEANIDHTILEGRAVGEFAELFIEAFDGRHEEIFNDVGIVQNTGYFIDNQLFYPGDAFTNPRKEVAVLALPIAGPWCSLPAALHYALSLRPGTVIPVHDWLLNDDGIDLTYRIASNVLAEHEILFTPLHNNETKEVSSRVTT
jgi:L-ascorbate metabolism protein UlaG (beta-lactamase superfamily)